MLNTRALSFKNKVILFVGSSLLLSIALLVSFSTSLFMEDKSAYYMDYGQNRAKLAAKAIEHQIEEVLSLSHAIDSLILKQNPKEIEHIFHEAAHSHHLKRMIVFKVERHKLLMSLMSLGEVEGVTLHTLDQLGWDSSRFLNEPISIAKGPSGMLAIANIIKQDKDSGNGYVYFIEPDWDKGSGTDGFQTSLVDSLGDAVVSSGANNSQLKRNQIVDIMRPILEEKVESGARKWTFEKEDFIIAYQKLKFPELSMICLISEQQAFSAVKGLFYRSWVFGLGLLFIVIGIVSIMLRKNAEAMTAIFEAMDKVCKGDFTGRVDTRTLEKDELGVFAESFNQMISSFESLVGLSVQKVEQKYTKEYSAGIKNSLYEKSDLKNSHAQFQVSQIFSKEFGGDWSHYEEIREYIILLFGNMDESGASGAFSLCAARGAISAYREFIRTVPTEAPNLKYLAAYLNSIFYEIGKGKKKFKCSLLMMDSTTGQMEFMNFGHPAPFIRRESKDVFEPLAIKSYSPLGAGPTLKANVTQFKLNSGDRFFWFTEGMLKTINSAGDMFNSKRVLDHLNQLHLVNSDEGQSIPKEMVIKFQKFMGDKISEITHDISFAMLIVPKKAKFVEKDEAA